MRASTESPDASSGAESVPQNLEITVPEQVKHEKAFSAPPDFQSTGGENSLQEHVPGVTLPRVSRAVKKRLKRVSIGSKIPINIHRVLPPSLPKFLETYEPLPLVTVKDELSDGMEFTWAHPRSNQGFRYDACIPAPELPHLGYVRSNRPPFCARVEELDSALGMSFTPDRMGAAAHEGYISARSNVFMTTGSWYYEVEMLRAEKYTDGFGAHVRVGLSTREFQLQTPVGFDIYSYGLSNTKGEKIHISAPEPFMEPFYTGDVLGFHVNLPCDEEVEVPLGVRRDPFTVLFEDNLYLESIDPVPSREAFKSLRRPFNAELDPSKSLTGSFIKVYRDAQLCGCLYEGLRRFLPDNAQPEEGERPNFCDERRGYYPTLSLFRGGAARFNFGPDFKYKLPEGARPLCERYEEQAADCFVLDVFDELEAEEFDEEIETLQVQAPNLSNSRQPLPKLPGVAKVRRVKQEGEGRSVN